MTSRQRELLTFIASFIDLHGISPTYDEMTAGLRMKSKSGAHRLVDLLVEDGFLKRPNHRVRGVELTHKGKVALGLAPELPECAKGLAFNHPAPWRIKESYGAEIIVDANDKQVNLNDTVTRRYICLNINHLLGENS